MRPLRVRLTVRNMLVLVALLALSCGLARLWTIRRLYLRQADSHAGFRAALTRTPADIAYWEARWTAQRAGLPASYPWPAQPPFVPAIARYHDAMRAKFEQAARYPWLTVEPDPL